MRQLTAILLTVVFAFSQYARQLSYLECKFSNLFKSVTVKCDCEKKSGAVKPVNIPVSNNHTHIHLDEFFIAFRERFAGRAFYLELQKPPFIKADEICPGYSSPSWLPPNIVALINA